MQYLFHFPKLCLALGLSVIFGNYVGHWVCLLFLGIMLAIGFVCCLGDLCLALGLSVCWLGELCLELGLSVCWLGELCLELGLSVCWLGELCLVMIGLFGLLFLEYLVVLKRTAY